MLQIQDRLPQLRPVTSHNSLDCGNRSWICNAAKCIILSGCSHCFSFHSMFWHYWLWPAPAVSEN